MTDIHKKGKIGQFFCKHQHVQWYMPVSSMFSCISGEERKLICKDCGKELDRQFFEYEGNGFK